MSASRAGEENGGGRGSTSETLKSGGWGNSATSDKDPSKVNGKWGSSGSTNASGGWGRNKDSAGSDQATRSNISSWNPLAENSKNTVCDASVDKYRRVDDSHRKKYEPELAKDDRDEISPNEHTTKRSETPKAAMGTSVGRGRGRGVSNKPAWMTRGVLSEVAEPGERAPCLNRSSQEALLQHAAVALGDGSTVDDSYQSHERPLSSTSETRRSIPVGRGRGVSNLPAWMNKAEARSITAVSSNEVAASSPVPTDAVSRPIPVGRGRGVSNQPAWMTRKDSGNVSSKEPASDVSGSRSPNWDTAPLSIGPGSVPVGRGRGVSNQPAWMTKADGKSSSINGSDASNSYSPSREQRILQSGSEERRGYHKRQENDDHRREYKRPRIEEIHESSRSSSRGSYRSSSRKSHYQNTNDDYGHDHDKRRYGHRDHEQQSAASKTDRKHLNDEDTYENGSRGYELSKRGYQK